jgi:hypothetical protein
MSRGRGKDFKKEIEEVAKRKDISQAEADFKIRKIYEAQKRAIEKELKEVNRQITEHTTRTDAQTKLLNATKQYTAQTAQAVDKATKGIVQQVARETAEAHVKAGQQLLQSAGAKRTIQASMIANNEVNATVARTLKQILDGNAYPNPYTLSQRIWLNVEANQKDIHTIIMSGMQEGKSIADISDMITQYVDPRVSKNWNKRMADGFYVHRRNVEYNAQRLARTVAQHSYQKATEDRARSNPFITGFRWLANGSRPCPICIARDGRVYAKGEAPLDHPNGMCTLEPVIQDDEVDARLIAWTKGAEDRELTAYARQLGYEQ